MSITKGRVLDRHTARVALNMLARDMSKGTVADLCETSISSIDRVRQYSERNHGAVRDPQPGKGKQGDGRWHFGGAMGLSSSMLLHRVAGGMDASSTHEEIYDEYCCVCPQPHPAFSTASRPLLRICANWATRPSGSARGIPPATTRAALPGTPASRRSSAQAAAVRR